MTTTGFDVEPVVAVVDGVNTAVKVFRPIPTPAGTMNTAVGDGRSNAAGAPLGMGTLVNTWFPRWNESTPPSGLTPPTETVAVNFTVDRPLICDPGLAASCTVDVHGWTTMIAVVVTLR